MVEDDLSNSKGDGLWEKLKQSVTPLKKERQRVQDVESLKKDQQQGQSKRVQQIKTEQIQSKKDQSEPFQSEWNSPILPVPSKLQPTGKASSLSGVQKQEPRLQNLKNLKQVRTGRVKVDATIDFHGLSQEQAYRFLSRSLRQKSVQGVRCLLVITGKGSGRSGFSRADGHMEVTSGRGVLREKLVEWLEQDILKSSLYGYAQAHRIHGGSGAYYLFLRRYEKVLTTRTKK